MEVSKVEYESPTSLALQAEIDIQISTAKKYPRDVARSINNAIQMVIDDDELALSCTYKLPRGDKPITGPSIRLAEVVASTWGNLRVKNEVAEVHDDYVVSIGYAHDLETNVAFCTSVKKSIVDKNGRRYSKDMIVVTGNAAGAIACRNALFKVIPKSYVNKIEEAAKKSLAEDKEKLPQRIEACLGKFRDIGVSENQILEHLKIEDKSSINGRHLGILSGAFASIEDGLLTADEVFKKQEVKPEEPKEIARELASKKDIEDMRESWTEAGYEIDGEFMAKMDAGDVTYAELQEEAFKMAGLDL